MIVIYIFHGLDASCKVIEMILVRYDNRHKRFVLKAVVDFIEARCNAVLYGSVHTHPFKMRAHGIYSRRVRIDLCRCALCRGVLVYSPVVEYTRYVAHALGLLHTAKYIVVIL